MSDKENNIENEINVEDEISIEDQEYDLDSGLNDDLDESEKIAEMLRKSETLSSGSKNTEEDNKLDDELSQFVDGEGSDDEEAGSESDGREEDGIAEDGIEESAVIRKLEEEKLAKIKRIRLVSVVSAATVVVLAAGILAFFMIFNNMQPSVISYQREVDGVSRTERIGLDDFKFLVLMSQSFEGAMNTALTIIAAEVFADTRGISLSEDELQSIRATAEEWQGYIEEDYPELNVSLDFLVKYHSLNSWAAKLFDVITDEFEVDEADYAAALADYLINGKADYIHAEFKYIETGTRETADEARAAVISGEMSFDEAVSRYYYNNEYFAEKYGYESLDQILEEFGEFETIDAVLESIGMDTVIYLDELAGSYGLYEEIDTLLAMQPGEISEIYDIFGSAYVFFVLDNIDIPTEDLVAEMYRSMYIESRVEEIFFSEFELLYNEVEESANINQRAIDNIDLEELFGY